MMRDECQSHFPRLITPTSQGTNRLLWGDWSKKEYGFLVRTLDLHDRPDKMLKWIEIDPLFPGFNSSLIPASFVHASQQAPNVLFNLPNRLVVAGILVGSQFRKNNPSGSVHAPVCYPLDAGSNKREGMLSDNGKGCRPDGPAREGMCSSETGKCLFLPENECACNYKDVPSHTFGDFFSNWLETAPRVMKGEPVGRSDFYTCWFDTSDVGLSEMISASNSYWVERRRWTRYNDSFYWGWNECATTANMKTDPSVADAIILQLPRRHAPPISLCDFRKRAINDTLDELIKIHDRGYENLPIVFMEQTAGMPNRTECSAMWKGARCRSGFRKEIFAQTYNFTDGSCLAIPDGCKDVYFFPPDPTTGKCNVSSDACVLREKTSPYHHFQSSDTFSLVSFHNEALAAFERYVGMDDGAAIPLPRSSLLVVVNGLAMLCMYRALRRRKGKSMFAYPSSSFFLPKFLMMSLALVMLPLFFISARIGHTMSTTLNEAANMSSKVTNDMVQDSMARNPLVQLPVKQEWAIARVNQKSKEDSAHSIAACPAVVPKDTRILLLTVVQAFHGSTALASVLMSSPNIASYCSAKTWQCEGFPKAKQFACPNRPTQCLRDKRQLPPNITVSSERHDINLFDLFSFDWNLSRPILHDKLFPRETGYTELWQQSLSRRDLAPQMSKLGIRKVIPVYIMMWTPLCVLNVQTRSRMALETRNRDFLQRELWNLQQMKQQHEELLKAGTAVLVICYADLLFREEYTLNRINAFLPCAGHVHANFLPQLGVDVFPENKWKVRGTVHEFSKGLNPTKCCGYNVQEHTCTNRTSFSLIPEFEEQLTELDVYFSKYSI